MLNDLPTERVTPALRFLAAEAKLSQQSLGERVGLSQSAMARRLSGDTPTNLDDLSRIAGALGYDVRITFVERSQQAVAS